MEDSNVSLSCTYTGIAGLTKYLHWYRQYDTSKTRIPPSHWRCSWE
uniref:Ig-like domain-containing protein n=1 Tax=Anguilla anguilla TaxID=7936 RepID=A0A0E9UP30_ANGAN